MGGRCHAAATESYIVWGRGEEAGGVLSEVHVQGEEREGSRIRKAKRG